MTTNLRQIHCQTAAVRSIPSTSPAAAGPNKVNYLRVIVDKKVVEDWLASNADRQTMKVSMCRNAISIAKRNANGGANALENARATDIDKKNSQQVASRARSQTFPAVPVFRKAKIHGMHLNMQRSYLQIVDGGTCLRGPAEDTVTLFLLECPAYDLQRVALRDFVRHSEWKWPEEAKHLVSSPDVFHCFSDFYDEALYLKSCE